MTILERLAEYLCGLAHDRLATGDRAILENHLIDAVGAGLAGAHSPDGDAVLGFDPRRALAGGRRSRTPDPLRALAARVAATRSTEIDDIHMESCTTPGAVVVPAALTVAQYRPEVDGATLAAAILAGYEAMTRMGTAINGAAIVYRGLWPTYFCAPLAAAATVGRLIGLAPPAMTHALAIALATATGGAGRPRGSIGSRWLLVGHAARSGALAAMAAAEGFAGDPTLLDGDWLTVAHGVSADMGPIAETGGPPMLRALSLKPWCSAKQAMAAIHGMGEIVADGIDPAAIASVRVSVPPAYAAMIGHQAAEDVRVSTLTSAAYQMALSALRPEGLYDVARDRLIRDPAVATLAQKIAVEADEALARHWPARYPARVRVTAGDVTREVLVLDAPGDPDRRLDRAGVLAKAGRFADGRIPPAARDALIAAAAGAFDGAHGPARLAEAYAALFARRRDGRSRSARSGPGTRPGRSE